MNIDPNDMLEAISAQRNQAQNEVATHFAQRMAEKRRADAAEARVRELEEKYEPKPKLGAVA